MIPYDSVFIQGLIIKLSGNPLLPVRLVNRMVGVVAGDEIILADRSFDQLRFHIRLFPAV